MLPVEGRSARRSVVVDILAMCDAEGGADVGKFWGRRETRTGFRRLNRNIHHDTIATTAVIRIGGARAPFGSEGEY